VLHYHTSTSTVEAIEDTTFKACTGPNSALSVEIATWRITTAATKSTGTALTETDEVFGFETLFRRYNEKIKRFQADNHPASGRHFKPPFNTFSTDVREPCQWCLENKNTFFCHAGFRLFPWLVLPLPDAAASPGVDLRLAQFERMLPPYFIVTDFTSYLLNFESN